MDRGFDRDRHYDSREHTDRRPLASQDEMRVPRRNEDHFHRDDPGRDQGRREYKEGFHQTRPKSYTVNQLKIAEPQYFEAAPSKYGKPLPPRHHR